MVDKDFEKKVLNHILKNLIVATDCEKRGIQAEFFRWKPHYWLYRCVRWFVRTYEALPALADITEIVNKENAISPDMRKTILVLVADLLAEPISGHPTFILDEFLSYHKRMLLVEGLRQATELMAENKPDAALSHIMERATTITKFFNPSNDHTGTIMEHSPRIALEYDDRKLNPDKYRGIYIGFGEFDRLTDGLRPGTVTLIIGAYKSGKSVLSVNIGHNVACPNPQRGWPGQMVYYHVNEGGYTLAQDRFLSCATGLPYGNLHHQKLAPPEEAILKQFLNDPATATLRSNFYIDPVSPLNSTSLYIQQKVQELSMTRTVGLVIVDYLGLMQTTARIESSWERLGAITYELVDTAKRLQVPLIVIAHVNREGIKSTKKDDEKNFDPEDLGLSLEPLKHVDNIVAWRIQDQESFQSTHTGRGLLSIQLARDASTGTCQLDVDTNIMKIKDIVVGAPGSVGH